MDDKTECTFTNFVDNTELGGDVDRPEKRTTMYIQLGRLRDWTNKIHTRFNQDTREVCILVGRIPHSSTGWDLTE